MYQRSAIITVAGLALGSLLLAGSPAGAQSAYAPYVDQRQDYQQQHIQQGVNSGALTPGETGYLDRQQGHIQNAEGRMAADGNLSGRERDRLNRMENRASRDIYRLNHNDRTTQGWGGNNYGWSGHTNSAWNRNTYDPRIERREAYQDRRIDQGTRSGALTPGEARYLNGQQARIDRVEDRMRADGNLSPRERQRLSQMQNQANRDIYRLENNNRTMGGYNGSHGGWQGHDRDRDRWNHGWQANNRNWDRRDGWHGDNRWDRRDGRHGDNRGWDRRDAGWQANRGWEGRNNGWHGNNPAGNGYPSRAGYTPGQDNGNSGWHGTNPMGNGYPSRVTTPGGTTTASNPQGWQGNSARYGQQPAGYQRPAAPAGAGPGQPTAWQGQPQYQRPAVQGLQPQMRPSQSAPWQNRQQIQQVRAPMAQPAMRPNTNMAGRQPMLGGMVNRANFSMPRGGFGRR